MVERYDRVAELYDLIKMDEADDFVKRTVSYFKNKNFNPKTVLDIACGTGTVTIKLAEQGYSMVGMDISEKMLEVARKKAKQKDLTIDFRLGDMTSFKLDEKVDLIIASGSPLYMGNFSEEKVEMALKSVYESLNTGGYFAFDLLNFDQFKDYFIHNVGGFPAISQETYQYQGKDYSDVVDLKGEDTMIVKIRSDSDVILKEFYKRTDLEEMLQHLKKFNFKDVHVEKIKNGFQEDYLIFVKKI